MMFDLIIRGGLIVDGSGDEPYIGDIAIEGGGIVAVGEVDGGAVDGVEVAGEGVRVIDAAGRIVTPGFVDIHTHYDGQAVWAERMSPSSSHGVTTVVVGNCGVGFAPCRPQDHDLLVDVMTGVEDIPGVVMTEGLPWTWETFPQFLDALEARPRDIDVAAFLPHSPLRVYVMGARGAAREPAGPDDLREMRLLAREAVRAGAIGFSSSRLIMHRTGGGEAIPSYGVAQDEVAAIADGLVDAGGGLLQFVPDLPMEGYGKVLEPMFAVARDKGLPLTFTLATGNEGPQIWPGALALVTAANEAGGTISAQIFPRPIGMVLGLELSAHPFVGTPAYRAIADLPLARRVAAMRRPEVRARILAEQPLPGHPLTQMARNWRWIFPLGDAPDYEPTPADSLAARAAARGVPVEEEAYDRLLDDDGHAMLLLALGNLQDNRLDVIGDLMRRDDVVLGLGDGGAHYGMICDASFPTFLLTHWVRDRVGERLSLAAAVRHLTARPAEVAGLLDRGRLAPGLKADLNIIDPDALRLHRPTLAHDLPGGGRRLDQTADGYVATIVSGTVIAEQGRPTGALPGRLVRGRRGPDGRRTGVAGADRPARVAERVGEGAV